MQTFVARNRLLLVDTVWSTMTDAGYDLSRDDIAFVWRAARSEASPDEIATWTSTIASRLHNRPPQPETLHRLTAIASDLNDNLARLRRGIAEIRASANPSR